MKKILLLAVVALLVVAGTASAQIGTRVEIGIDKPMMANLGTVEFDFSRAEIFLPDVGAYLQLKLGPITAGGGVRALTAIIAGFWWLNTFAEIDLGAIVVQAQVGGGLYGYWFGDASEVAKVPFYIVDLNAALDLGDFLRLGVGVAAPYYQGANPRELPYLGYVNAKIIIQ